MIKPVHAVCLADYLYLFKLPYGCRHVHIVRLFQKFFFLIFQLRVHTVPDDQRDKRDQHLSFKRFTRIYPHTPVAQEALIRFEQLFRGVPALIEI